MTLRVPALTAVSCAAANNGNTRARTEIEIHRSTGIDRMFVFRLVMERRCGCWFRRVRVIKVHGVSEQLQFAFGGSDLGAQPVLVSVAPPGKFESRVALCNLYRRKRSIRAVEQEDGGRSLAAHDMNANLNFSPARRRQSITRECRSPVGGSGELQQTIARSSEVDKDVAGLDAFEYGWNRQLRCIYHGRGTAHRTRFLQRDFGPVIIATSNGGGPQPRMKLLFPKHESRKPAVRDAAVHRFDCRDESHIHGGT